MAEICRGGTIWGQLLAIEVSFRINKPGFRGLMAELATHSLVREADLYDVISLKIEQLFT